MPPCDILQVMEQEANVEVAAMVEKGGVEEVEDTEGSDLRKVVTWLSSFSDNETSILYVMMMITN